MSPYFKPNEKYLPTHSSQLFLHKIGKKGLTLPRPLWRHECQLASPEPTAGQAAKSVRCAAHCLSPGWKSNSKDIYIYIFSFGIPHQHVGLWGLRFFEQFVVSFFERFWRPKGILQDITLWLIKGRLPLKVQHVFHCEVLNAVICGNQIAVWDQTLLALDLSIMDLHGRQSHFFRRLLQLRAPGASQLNVCQELFSSHVFYIEIIFKPQIYKQCDWGAYFERPAVDIDSFSGSARGSIGVAKSFWSLIAVLRGWSLLKIPPLLHKNTHISMSINFSPSGVWRAWSLCWLLTSVQMPSIWSRVVNWSFWHYGLGRLCDS